MRPKLLLAVPAVVYVLAAIYAHQRGHERTTGDEPHYLQIAESIAADADVNLDNNRKKFGSLPGASHCIATPNGWFSVHNLGLPVLVVLPWTAGGPLGARLIVALFTGLAAPVLYHAINAVWQQPRGSLLLALALALGMPLVHASRQIYPDLPAGILLLYLAGRAVLAQTAPATNAWPDVWSPVALALLPWLHVKYAGAVLVAFAWQSLTVRRKQVAINAASLAASLAMLAFYNWFAFGKASGPYADAEALNAQLNSFIVFMGLHFDQAQGMFLQQPLWLLGLAGLAPMWRARWSTGLWWTLLYAAAILPNAMHPNWYGGHSFIGRFGATAVLLWAIPLAFAARTWFASEVRLPAIFAAASLGLQLCLAGNWLSSGRSLMNQCGRAEIWWTCPWCYKGFVPTVLRDYLPYWQPWVDFWHYPANFAALVVAVGLLTFGLFSPQRRKPALRCLLAVVVGAALLLAIPFHAPVAVCSGNQLPDFVGRKGRMEGTRYIAEEGVDDAGAVVLAPEFLPRPGEYRVIVDYEAQGTTGPIGHVMLHDGKTLSVLSTLTGQAGPQQNISSLHLPRVDTDKPSTIVIWYGGRGTLSIAQLAVERRVR